jgi:hypothetical protein
MEKELSCAQSSRLSSEPKLNTQGLKHPSIQGLN